MYFGLKKEIMMNLLQLLEINNEKKDSYHDKKNIICLYPSYSTLKAIFDDETIFIAVLTVYREVLESNEFLELIIKNKNRIGRITSSLASYEEFDEMFKTDYQLDLREIALYRDAQLNCTREMARSVLPLVEIDYRYFTALSFWLSIFKRHEIQFVITGCNIHGNLLDSLATGIARQRTVPVYILSCQYRAMEKNLISMGKILVSIKKDYHGEEKFIAVNNILGNFTIDIKPYCFNKVNQNKEKEKEIEVIKNFFWLKLERRIRFFINNHILSTKEAFILQAKKFKSHFTYGILEMADSLTYIKEIKKNYHALSDTIDKKEKYIYFPLHIEPEARVFNGSSCSNQLFLIKMVADNLPEGWKVYVKEHPNQFDIKKQRLWYMFYSIKIFRPKSFYYHLYKMKNVKLINHAVLSEALIENSMAVASLSGTVCIECLSKNKPLLYMGKLLSVVNELSCIYKINNGEDVKNALKNIENNLKLDTSNFGEELSAYVFEVDEKKDFCYDESEVIKSGKILKWMIKDSMERE